MTKEQKIIKLFNSKFTRNIKDRIIKLEEEFNEFKEVYDEFEGTSFDEKGNIYLHLQDEAADVYAVVLDLINIVGLNHDTAIEMIFDKITKRDINPNYKKDW